MFLAVLASAWFVLRRGERFYGELIRGWDAQFYYASARSLVYGHDLDVTDDLPLSPVLAPFDLDGDGILEQLPRRGDRVINKYPIGLSLAEVPWLVVGGGLRWAVGDASARAPGYSPLEIRTVAFGLTVYFACGMALLAALLTRVVPVWTAGVAMVAAWLGTSLFFYSAVFPFMAHALACTLIVLAITLAVRGVERPSEAPVCLALLGLVGGFLFLVRPQQVTLGAVLVPALLWRLQAGGTLLLSRRIVGGVALGVAAFAMCVGVQVLINRANTGLTSINAYGAGGEGFDLLHPHLGMVLLSGGRGWLTFSPLVLLALVGHLRLAARRAMPWWGHVLGVHTLIQMYLVAAWSSPEQGEAFGGRMLTDLAPWVALGLGSLLTAQRGWRRGAWLLLSVVSVAWTLALLLVYLRVGIPASTTLSGLLTRLTGH